MARSPKSTIMLASLVSWAGVILVALIVIYGPHGPARHGKMVAGPVLMMGVLSLAALQKMSCSKLVIGTHAGLWFVAMLTGALIGGTDLGEGLHPLVTPVIFLVLGAISLVILSMARIAEPVSVVESEG